MTNEEELIDHQQYYAEIIRFLQDADTGRVDSTVVNKPWVKIHAANYFVIPYSRFIRERFDANRCVKYTVERWSAVLW